MIKPIHTENAPAAVGPYSQAIDTGSVVYLSGQIPLNPQTGEMVTGDIKASTRQVLENLKAVLAEAGLTFADVAKCEVFLASMGDFVAMNEVYAEYFTENKPARQAIEAAALPKGADVEISCIAVRG
jgi:2-iminobutanoate/2-iminopropanoate deaminase